MMITKKQLTRIIKEEKAKLIHENIGGISQALIDDYNSWVHREGHITPAASSVMASYFIATGIEEDDVALKMMSDYFKIDRRDVSIDIRRQQKEKSTVVGESKMKITKRQLRRIIREAIDPKEFEEPLGGWVGDALSNDPDYKHHTDTDSYMPTDFNEVNWMPWLKERGLSVDDLDDLANYVGAPDRFTLDAHPPVDGMIGPADIEEWAEDQRAAREILSTRAGSYKGTVLPDGRKI